MELSKTYSYITSSILFCYGLFNLVRYILLSMKGFHLNIQTEKDELELQIARNNFWNLSKHWSIFTHQIITLKDGFKFHYITNRDSHSPPQPPKPLVIFIHGFPDSWVLWRYILSSTFLQNSAIMIAVDLPGHGGSDSPKEYTLTRILGLLTEFIVTARKEQGNIGPKRTQTVIVSHDWGCILAMRLAAEAPQLADRFILSNGPVPGIILSNTIQTLKSALTLLALSLHSAESFPECILKATKTLAPLLKQAWKIGYIFAFQLPMPLPVYLGTTRKAAFLKLVHEIAYGEAGFELPSDAADCMASTLGPSLKEYNTRTAEGATYPISIFEGSSNFRNMVQYYRGEIDVADWDKSAKLVAELESLSDGSSSGSSQRAECRECVRRPKYALQTKATILWGMEDMFLESGLSLGGVSDYLVGDSQVLKLPRSGHWVPLEPEGRAVMGRVVEWAVRGEKEGIEDVVRGSYPGVVVERAGE
ncbi:hypothetical protein BBP40_009821 [Aspergillus hancockii]|nr:hypothetical protein BBP40_009821 [Aspergillus hancockii]